MARPQIAVVGTGSMGSLHARVLHNSPRADLAVVAVVHKMSTLIASMHVWMVDVSSRRIVRQAAVSLRGDTGEAWSRAVTYLVRNSLLNDDPAHPSLSSPFPGG